MNKELEKIQLDLRHFKQEELPIPDGATLGSLFLEGDELVGYGCPEETHNCDEMGCPSTQHVIFVKKVNKGQLFPKPDEGLRERIASRYMVQCKNSKDFECLYIGTCPHEDKEICQWQLDNADEILALTASIYEEEKIEYGESVNENIYRHGNQGNST